MADFVTKDEVKGLLDEQSLQIFKYTQKEFQRIDKRLDNTATKDQVDKLIVTLDTFLKRLDNI